ncbi:MAG TPA: hypothetical protein VG759_24865 [Candidatus Angelobacter sp.]|jgi:hypothetical protein|nr:hypothetical protein [Candidatus Angelobacter sp.]
MRHVTKALGIILFAASACFGAFAQTPTSNAAASVNQRGMGNRFSPSVRTGNTTTVIGSESYTYAVPMFSLPGRHGLNLSLSLVYNNLIWTSSLGAGGVIYNFDSAYQPNGGTPSYGFRLDFGSLIWFTSSGSTSGLLIDATGGKHALIYSGSGNVYNTIDSTYISVQHTGGDQPSDVLTYKNGTQVFYHFAITNALGNITVTQPVKIEDSSGNFITINYAGGNQFTPPALSSVVDTVGRTLKFIYNNGLLSCVTDGTACGASGSRTFNFTWNTSYILNYNFSQIVFNSWSAANPLQGNNFPYTVLAGVTRPDGTQVKFNYGDWLIVNDIQEFSNNGTLRYETNYNFPLASAGQLSSPPAYTQQTATTFDKDGNSKQAIWSYQTVQSSPLPAEKIISCFAVTDPAGTIHITTFRAKATYLTLCLYRQPPPPDQAPPAHPHQLRSYARSIRNGLRIPMRLETLPVVIQERRP